MHRVVLLRQDKRLNCRADITSTASGGGGGWEYTTGRGPVLELMPPSHVGFWSVGMLASGLRHALARPLGIINGRTNMRVGAQSKKN